MANTKISALTSATTPLAGTEVLPLVQSAATKKVTVSDLTSGRAVIAASFTASGNNAYCYAEVADGSGHGQALMKAGDSAGRYMAMRGTSYDYDPAFLTSGAANVTMKNLAAQATSMTWGSTGDITFNAGNLIQGTAAKGINFTANTGAAGKTSQLLNWYEEGTWTPNFSAWTTAPTSTSGCLYTRIGRQVTVVLTAKDGVCGNTGQAITGLPFTASAAAVASFRDVSGGGVTTFGAVSGSSTSISSITAATFTGLFWTMSATYFV